MRIIRAADVDEKENSTELFSAPVMMRAMGTDQDSDYSIVYVSFPKGVRNKYHEHDTVQVLIVTEGEGYIVKDDNKKKIVVGDVVVIQPGEVHWHGATETSAMTHISLTPKDSKITQTEK